ncbi:Metallo-hydrolase/oxidoreductase [Atractiella rhizophila]|nr:Metallo-hydrolase/oxidoreductase [Atractiella rhizophila]
MSSDNLSLPAFRGTNVRVSLIHCGRTTVPTAYVVTKQITGHDILDIPCFSFLVENERIGKKVLFDLGLMKAWKEKQPPAILGQIEFAKAAMDITQDVADQLKANQLPLELINAIIWSHHHIDHTGDPSLFPKTTALVVGPGFKSNKATYPGYPANPDAVVVQDAFEGRELVELDFSNAELEIGGLKALDYFEDGSFYLLQAPGHTHDHIAGLARISDTKFVFLGGDTAHHVGEFRPTIHLPLPESITPSPFDGPFTNTACLGSLFEYAHPQSSTEPQGDYRTMPFYELSPIMNVDLDQALVSLERMKAFDAHQDVLVIVAHDSSLLDVLPLYPAHLTWGSGELKMRGRWRFLKDFEKAANLSAATNI